MPPQLFYYSLHRYVEYYIDITNSSTMASSSPIYRLLLLGILILHCNSYCNAFVPPPTSSTLQALPIDEILTSSTTTSVVSSTSSSHVSSLLLQSSTLLSTTAATATDITTSTDILSTLLRTPTLWSVLAMTSIVALLVAWEEAIE